MRNPPCGGCNWWLGRRVEPNCHDTCERYQKWRRERYRGQRHRTEVDDYVAEAMVRRKEGQRL